MSTTRAPATTQTDGPALAADLARTLHDSGWSLIGAAVRVVHTARLSDASGLTVAISAEAGQIHLDFDSEYRYLDGPGSRPAWHAESSGALCTAVLSAVASANVVAIDHGDGPDIAAMLAAAGWRRANDFDPTWTSPDASRQVVRVDDLPNTDLPWEIRLKTGRGVTVYASADTPCAVIAAFALTDVV